MKEFHFDQSFAGLNFHEPRQRFSNQRGIDASIEQTLARHLSTIYLPQTSGVIIERSDRLIADSLTLARVEQHFQGVISGGVERFELPNLWALNFLLHGALDGGGTLSLKTDAQGKVFSTSMLRLVLDVPDAEAEQLGLPAAT